MIKAVILHHNQPESADKLYESLSEAFDGVELIDCGSSPSKMPINVTVPLENVYWEGAWLEAMRRWGDSEVLWILGGDIELLDKAEVYRQAIEAAMPFGCWSPSITGRAHSFMLTKHGNKRVRVKNIEGMALAVSRELMASIDYQFALSTKIGFGQDYWMCAMSRRDGLKNYIDGGVSVYHPPSIGYNEDDAHSRMQESFSQKYGADFRNTLFEYTMDYYGNQIKDESMNERKIVVATVDNGWGVKEFESLVATHPDCRGVIMRKGLSKFSSSTSEIIEYDASLKAVLDADIVLFTKVGAANRADFVKLVDAGCLMLANERYNNGKIVHQKTGWLYGHPSWGEGWLKEIVKRAKKGLKQSSSSTPIDSQSANSEFQAMFETAKRVGQAAQSTQLVIPAAQQIVPSIQNSPLPTQLDSQPTQLDSQPTQIDSQSTQLDSQPTQPLVTIITPTFNRDPRIVSRCLDCVSLQTVKEIEHLVCSDGKPESQIASLVGSLGDMRVSYHNTSVKKPGDFGNTVRSEMLGRARGKYILFLDDDNLILPDYLERMISAIEDSGKDFAVCRVVHFGPLKEDEVGRPPQVLTGIPVRLHHVDTLQVLVKREVMQRVGWNVEKGYLADGYTLQKLASEAEYVEVVQVLGFHM